MKPEAAPDGVFAGARVATEALPTSRPGETRGQRGVSLVHGTFGDGIAARGTAA